MIVGVVVALGVLVVVDVNELVNLYTGVLVGSTVNVGAVLSTGFIVGITPVLDFSLQPVEMKTNAATTIIEILCLIKFIMLPQIKTRRDLQSQVEKTIHYHHNEL